MEFIITHFHLEHKDDKYARILNCTLHDSSSFCHIHWPAEALGESLTCVKCLIIIIEWMNLGYVATLVTLAKKNDIFKNLVSVFTNKEKSYHFANKILKNQV